MAWKLVSGHSLLWALPDFSNKCVLTECFHWRWAFSLPLCAGVCALRVCINVHGHAWGSAFPGWLKIGYMQSVQCCCKETWDPQSCSAVTPKLLHKTPLHAFPWGWQRCLSTHREALVLVSWICDWACCSSRWSPLRQLFSTNSWRQGCVRASPAAITALSQHSLPAVPEKLRRVRSWCQRVQRRVPLLPWLLPFCCNYLWDLRGKGSLRVSLIRTLISLVRAPSSWPNHLSKYLSLNIIIFGGLGFQHMNSGQCKHPDISRVSSGTLNHQALMGLKSHLNEWFKS